MMIEYKEFVLKSGKKDIAVIVHEKNGETLSSFLFRLRRRTEKYSR